jgi:hypothetical protein
VRTFFTYFFLAPPSAVVFGFLGWMLAAVLVRGAMPRRRVGVYTLFRIGYIILAAVGVYWVASSDNSDLAPLLGTVTSFAVVWLIRREWLRRRRGWY